MRSLRLSLLNSRRLFITRSVRSQMVAMIETASSGYLPLRIHQTASLHQYRRGWRLQRHRLLRESGVGFDHGIQHLGRSDNDFTCTDTFSIIIFWAKITSSTGISTPRSPRATMMPSEASRISSKLLRPSWFSILEMMWMFSPPCAFRCSRISITSERLRIKEAATKSTPCSQPKIRSCLSFQPVLAEQWKRQAGSHLCFRPGHRCSALYR